MGSRQWGRGGGCGRVVRDCSCVHLHGGMFADGFGGARGKWGSDRMLRTNRVTVGKIFTTEHTEHTEGKAERIIID